MEMDFTKVKLNKEQQNNAFLIGSKAQEMGIDPDLALAFAWRENRFQTKGKSPKGATGVMQVMPANAKAYGYEVEDLQDPTHNIDVGLKIFKENLDMFDGDEIAALVAYNANPNVAKRFLKSNKSKESIPEETQTYLDDIHSIRPLVSAPSIISEATADESSVFRRPEKAPPSETTFKVGEVDEPSFVSEHPVMSGFGAGFGAGALEQLYNYAKKAGNKEAVAQLEQELLRNRDGRMGTMKDNLSGRQRYLDFNLETSTQAEEARNAKAIEDELRRKGIVSGESPRTRFGSFITSSADSPILVKPEALLKEEPPLTETQKFARKVAEKIPGYRRFAPKITSALSGISEGASRALSKAPIATTTAIGGLGVGVPLDVARERFQKGDIKGGLLSAGTSVANLLSMAPTPMRGPAFLASIPLDIANVLYNPKESYESVTKRFPPKD